MAIVGGDGRPYRPRLGITIGDPGGVGPEMIVKALADDRLYERCRPVVIGDARHLVRAAVICDRKVEVRAVDPGAASDGPETIACIDAGTPAAEIPFGQATEAGWRTARLAVECAGRLIATRQIDALCTAPITSDALHRVLPEYAGQSELLASLTGTSDFSVLLVAGGIRVLHVSTHIGLRDLLDTINPDMVFRTIERGHDLLRRAGIEEPWIAVCGVNPHAGNDGLIGRGEDAAVVQPAADRARAHGMRVDGPLGADFIFTRACQGDFDLVVAMYHDQGHNPIRVLGASGAVSATVGLPVIRTSVDSGPDFAHAGTGAVDASDLLEAMFQAANLAEIR